MKNKIKVHFFKTKEDYKHNLEDYGKKTNILLITGLVGSGKSTLARKLGKEYNATVVIQDYLAWSDCYDDETSKFFVNLFQEKYPETKEYFLNNEWRKSNLSKEEKTEYRKKFDKVIIEYALEHNDHLFIYEGSDMFCKSNPEILAKYPFIIKRTSVFRSFFQSYKRGNVGNKTLKDKLKYVKRMTYEFYRFYIKDLPKLNHFINYIEKEK